jgi:hypothetical protein
MMVVYIDDKEELDQYNNNKAVVDHKLETSSCVAMMKKQVIQNTMNSMKMYHNYYNMDMVNTTNKMNNFHHMKIPCLISFRINE